MVAFFYIWLLAVLHALVRPVRAARIERLGCAALLCLLLPLLTR